MDEAANEEVMRINREVLRILDEYWSKPDNLGPEVWAEIEKAMADPCGHLEEISRLRAENDKANKGLERAGEIETTLRAALREADEREARWRDTFAEEMAHTMEQYEALGLDTEAVKERPIHELMMGRIAALREAEGDFASVTDFLNTWAREDGIEQAESPKFAKKTIDMILGRVSQKLAQAEADKARLAGHLRAVLFGLSLQGKEYNHVWKERMDKAIEGATSALNALVPGTALEAVREVIDRLEEGSHRATEDGDQLGEEWFDELATNLRAAFGLAGEGGER